MVAEYYAQSTSYLDQNFNTVGTETCYKAMEWEFCELSRNGQQQG